MLTIYLLFTSSEDKEFLAQKLFVVLYKNVSPLSQSSMKQTLKHLICTIERGKIHQNNVGHLFLSHEVLHNERMMWKRG